MKPMKTNETNETNENPGPGPGPALARALTPDVFFVFTMYPVSTHTVACFFAKTTLLRGPQAKWLFQKEPHRNFTSGDSLTASSLHSETNSSRICFAK